MTRAPLRAVVFAGHRIDAPGRATPRFPASCEAAARRSIEHEVEAETRRFGAGALLGLAGAASGGDILFHEVCEDLGVTSEVLLALPEADYEQASVADSGPDWVRRFRALCARRVTTIRDLSRPAPEQPPDGRVWVRSTEWLLDTAFERATAGVSVIVLWDLEYGDGEGGTEWMLDRGRERGADVVAIHTTPIFGLE